MVICTLILLLRLTDHSVESTTASCGPNCRNGTCENIETDTIPTCSQGCLTGFTGKQCQEHCLDKCLECHQFTGKCTSCMEGRRGEDCLMTSVTTVATTTSTSTSRTYSTISRSMHCAKLCDDCMKASMVCHEDGCICNDTVDFTHSNNVTSLPSPDKTNMTPESMPESKLSASESKSWVVGGLCSMLGCGLIFMCYKFYQRYQSKLSTRNRISEENDRGEIDSTSGSLPVDQGYTYIDDNNLESYYSRFKERDMSPPCPPTDNKYEPLGNNALIEVHVGSESSLSSISGTLFGNLFECNEISDSSTEERLCSGNDDSMEEYEMSTLSYLTPEITIHTGIP